MPSSPTSRQHVDQHRDLDAVAGRERQPLEQLAPRRDLAGERLAHAGELGVEERERRARQQVVDAAAAVGVVAAGRAGGGRRPSRTIDPPARNQRAEQAGAKCAEKPSVSASRKQTSSPSSTLSARHIASPLPSTGPWSGISSASWRRVAPARSADRRGAVGRGGVDHDDLVDRARLAQRRRARRRSARRSRRSRAPAGTPTRCWRRSAAIRSAG